MWQGGIMIIKIWLVIFLLICAITDLAQQHVYTMFCIANGMIISIMQFFIRDIDLTACSLGCLLGGVCLFVCIVSRESIGKGDAMIIGIIGIAIGFQETLEVLVWTFIIIAVVAIFGFLKKSINLKTKIPFIPFLFLGTIIEFVVGG